MIHLNVGNIFNEKIWFLMNTHETSSSYHIFLGSLHQPLIFLHNFIIFCIVAYLPWMVSYCILAYVNYSAQISFMALLWNCKDSLNLLHQNCHKTQHYSQFYLSHFFSTDYATSGFWHLYSNTNAFLKPFFYFVTL